MLRQTELPGNQAAQPNDRCLSVKHVRRNCLECCGGWAKAVTWCSCDGVNSTRCEFWPFRFGQQPASFRKKYGDRLVTPKLMPPADVNIDDLPAALELAAFAEISVDGYCQPAVPRPERSPEEVAAAREKMAAVRRKAR